MPGDVIIDRLEEHPNLPAILGVLAQLPHIADADLSRLAGVRGETRNTVSVAEARQRALSAVFEVISALFADDIAGGPNYIENDPTVTAVALHAVRDAVTAVHAQPILARWEYDALLTAWRSVIPETHPERAGPRPGGPDIKRLLETLPRLARRCHDAEGREAFEALVVTGEIGREGQVHPVGDCPTRRCALGGQVWSWRDSVVRKTGPAVVTSRPSRSKATAPTSLRAARDER